MEKSQYYAGGFLWNPDTREVLLHKRDAKAPINPNTWAFFGGLSEPEDAGDPKKTFARELEEELSIKISVEDVHELRHYLNAELNTYRYVYYCVSKLLKTEMKLTEGEDFDWVSIAETDGMLLTKYTKLDLEFFISEVVS